eukprot:317974_1
MVDNCVDDESINTVENSEFVDQDVESQSQAQSEPPYSELKRLWSTDVVETKASIMTMNNKSPGKNRARTVEFSSITKIIEDYDDSEENDCDDELSTSSDESSENDYT